MILGRRFNTLHVKSKIAQELRGIQTNSKPDISIPGFSYYPLALALSFPFIFASLLSRSALDPSRPISGIT